MMKKICLLVVCAVACCWVVLSCSSCCHGLRWWLGIKPPPLPQQVITNQIGLKKVELSSTAIKKFDRRPIPTYEEICKMFDRKGTTEFRKLFFGTEYIFYYQKTTFANTVFYIAYTPEDEFVFVNIDAPGRIVKKLSSPRSPRSFMIEKIHFGDKEYLAFSIQNLCDSLVCKFLIVKL